MTIDDRDAEIATLIRREIEKVKARAESCGWRPHEQGYYTAWGEIAGLRRALALVDPNPQS